MKIAVVGSSAELREAIDSYLRKYLPDMELLYLAPDRLCRGVLPIDTAAAFVLVGDMQGLENLRLLVSLYPVLPVTVVGKSPDYSLEAIRQQAKDYLILPLTDSEFRQAIWRMNLIDEGRLHLASSFIG